MSTHRHDPESRKINSRERVSKAIAHLDHVLPAQAPIQDFVHHNTLHGYQHLPFEEALAAAEKMTGISAYHTEEKNREYYRQGRITDEDLMSAFTQYPNLKHEEILCQLEDKAIYRHDIYRIALLYDIEAISLSQLNWQIEEMAALDRVQTDVPEHIGNDLLKADVHNSTVKSNSIRRLWRSLCDHLELITEAWHPEALLDLSLEQTEQWLENNQNKKSIHQHTQELARSGLEALFAEVGDTITLRGFVYALSGKDVLESIRPQLIRLCASALDEGVAAWQLPECSRLGLYGAWRQLAQFDAYPFLHELPDWPQIMADLPEDAIDNIIKQLEHFQIPQAQWEGYLRRLALELPGWAGMINWRQQHPKYYTANKVVPHLADYLAIRLTLDRLWLNQICRGIWKCEATLTALQHYFSKNLSEFVVRRKLFQGALPEYLSQQAQLLTVRAGSEQQCRSDWQQLADLIVTWQLSPLADKAGDISVNATAWRLFRLSQHLGLTAKHIQQLGKPGLLKLLIVLDQFDLKQRRQIWLLAYEANYREALFQALELNHNRGRWATRDKSPDAQIVFCMDEREESFRRQLEELNPAIETLGAAGFFGIPMNYKGLDAKRTVPLCPVVVTPVHEIDELPKPTELCKWRAHKKGYRFSKQAGNLIYHDLRRNLLLTHFGINLLAPFFLVVLLGKTLFSWLYEAASDFLYFILVPPVTTDLHITAQNPEIKSTPEQPSLGFTDKEQAERVSALLRVLGLTDKFAPIVALVGHGSTSKNNPHEAAHDCGACGGRQGGPNARAFAAMANRPEVRVLLAQQEIIIPEDTWFIGLQHDTCSDAMIWYDFDSIPKSLKETATRFQEQFRQTQALSAHERCRRFVSADKPASPHEAFQHVTLRSHDLSQVRPEFGHASNAAALIGRRAVTQGLFLDRRVFLISYDARQDADGKILESILLTAGPVGAGINLEYFFSTVNNDVIGCGTKVPHNIVGLFGVMEGATSDLRTGLPSQMIEIHEAMRLQLIVEAKTSILEQIYARQPSLKELIAGGWVLLSTIDPDTGEIFMFERGKGFVPWQAPAKKIPVFKKSSDCYHGLTLPVPPALIKQPELAV